jgi:PKD domain-containing protein/calcineurin-like phosphoesterase family protein
VVETTPAGSTDPFPPSSNPLPPPADRVAPPAGDAQPSFPIRAAFYYPWFPETWTVGGVLTDFTPTLGFYDSNSVGVIQQHVSAMRYGGIEAGISSWWGEGHRTDTRFQTVLSATTFNEWGEGTAVEGATEWSSSSGFGSYLDALHDNGRTSSSPASPPANHAPTASLSVSPNPVGTGQTVTFNASASSDPDGSIVSYKWDLDANGSFETDSGSSATTARSYSSAGKVTVKLRVTDNGGATADATRNLTVNAPAPSPPPPSGSDPVIAAAGDIACDPADGNFNSGNGTAGACRQKYTSDLLMGAGLAKVLTLGDNQYEDATLTKYLASFDPAWGRVRGLIRPAIGNHEYHTSGAAGYFDYFNGAGVSSGPAGDRTNGYYSFDVGSWHLIALNSNCSNVSCSAGSAQEQWLRADLAAHQNICTLAYWHHPRFSSGTHGNNSSVQPLWQALYDGNADVALNGHDHVYERFAPQNATGGSDPARGIREFVVGTGGKNHYSFTTTLPNSEVRNSDTYGVLRLTLRASGYDWRFEPEAGKSFSDSGSGACH